MFISVVANIDTSKIITPPIIGNQCKKLLQLLLTRKQGLHQGNNDSPIMANNGCPETITVTFEYLVDLIFT